MVSVIDLIQLHVSIDNILFKFFYTTIYFCFVTCYFNRSQTIRNCSQVVTEAAKMLKSIVKITYSATPTINHSLAAPNKNLQAIKGEYHKN